MSRNDYPSEPSESTEMQEIGAAVGGQLQRGLLLVRTIVEGATPMSLSELAERTELDPSTVSRLCQILIAEGYLVRECSGRRYCAGPRAISLLSPYHPINVFRREALEVLQRLRDVSGETSALTLFLGAERVIVEIAQGREALAPFYDTWLRTPLHASATGKIMLAHMGPKQQRDLLGPEPLAKSTPHTVTTFAELECQLSIGRAEGLIVSRDDMYVGITALAAPIFYAGKVPACLAIVGSSERLKHSSHKKVCDQLREAATLISNATPSWRALGRYLGI